MSDTFRDGVVTYWQARAAWWRLRAAYYGDRVGLRITAVFPYADDEITYALARDAFHFARLALCQPVREGDPEE